MPGTALHLLTSADHLCSESKPHNSARLSLHSQHFVTLSFRSVGSAVQRKTNQVSASLRSRSLRARMPTDDDLDCPQPLTGHHAMPGDLNRVALKSPGCGTFCSQPAKLSRASTCSPLTQAWAVEVHSRGKLNGAKAGYRLRSCTHRRSNHHGALDYKSATAGQWQPQSFRAWRPGAGWHP